MNFTQVFWATIAYFILIGCTWGTWTIINKYEPNYSQITLYACITVSSLSTLVCCAGYIYQFDQSRKTHKRAMDKYDKLSNEIDPLLDEDFMNNYRAPSSVTIAVSPVILSPQPTYKETLVIIGESIHLPGDQI